MANLEILEGNYWEHFKWEKDLSFVLPLNHWKRVAIRAAMTEILTEIHKIKNNG